MPKFCRKDGGGRGGRGWGAASAKGNEAILQYFIFTLARAKVHAQAVHVQLTIIILHVLYRMSIYLPNELHICKFFDKVFQADLIRIIASYFIWHYRAGFEPAKEFKQRECSVQGKSSLFLQC